MTDAAVLTLDDVHLGPQEIPLAPAGVLFCDIDGTIADITHRRRYLDQEPKDWKAFKSTLDQDGPIPHVIAAVQTLHGAGWKIVLMSGRDEASRAVTTDWLARYDVPFEALYMRPDGDYRRDDLVKDELLMTALFDGYEPTVIFDDRNQVVEMWRRHKLRCIQVAFGDF